MAAGDDEARPLLAERSTTPLPPSDIPSESCHTIVTFDPYGDPDNPRDWPRRYKWGIASLLVCAGFATTCNCISIVPMARTVVRDLGGDERSSSATALPVTIWELGEAIGPLIMGPVSELIGRYPTINVANSLLAVATALAALSRTTDQFTAARALTGLAVAANVLNPAIISDMFVAEERGTAMSLVLFAPLLGSALGPAAGGFLSEVFGWRFVIWLCFGLAVASELTFFAFSRETYSMCILRRRAATLRTKTGNKAITYLAGDESKGLFKSMLRPFILLFGSPVILIIALIVSVVFSLIYVMATTLPAILEDTYNLTTTQIGWVFFLPSFGSFSSVYVCKVSLDKIYIKLRDANGGIGLPEHRLPIAIIGGVTLPPAVALYGWSAELEMPLVVNLLAVLWIRFSMFLVLPPLTAYVVDACDIYSASAMTSVIVLRCLGCAIFPFSLAPLIDSIGYGWAFTGLAMLCLLLSFMLMLLQRYGAHWRKLSPYTTL